MTFQPPRGVLFLFSLWKHRTTTRAVVHHEDEGRTGPARCHYEALRERDSTTHQSMQHCDEQSLIDRRDLCVGPRRYNLCRAVEFCLTVRTICIDLCGYIYTLNYANEPQIGQFRTRSFAMLNFIIVYIYIYITIKIKILNFLLKPQVFTLFSKR